MKTCPKCHDPKAVFTKDKSRPDGKSFYCRSCNHKSNADRYVRFKDKRLSAAKIWVDKNRTKVNANQRARKANLRLKALHHYSNGAMVCACCHEPNTEFLCLDHIEGGGNKHRKTFTTSVWDWLLKHEYPKGFRVLCFNCNYAVIDDKPCPHKTKASARTGGILSGPAILEHIKSKDIQVAPFVIGNLNQASLDLTLGSWVTEYSNLVLDAKKPPVCSRYQIGDEGIVLQPGKGYLMHTEEVLGTTKFITVLDGKSSLGRLFISVHATAGYIDPGFLGQVTLEVTVTHPVRVYKGMRFCQVRYHTVVGLIDSYAKKGHYTGESARGPVASLAHLQLAELDQSIAQ